MQRMGFNQCMVARLSMGIAGVIFPCVDVCRCNPQCQLCASIPKFRREDVNVCIFQIPLFLLIRIRTVRRFFP